MKLYGITEQNINKFFEVVENCEGKVELVADGFRVDLKSRFAQYVSIAKIFFNNEVEEIELLAYTQNDVNKLIQFMTESGR